MTRVMKTVHVTWSARLTLGAVLGVLTLAGPAVLPAQAEPAFLSRQYTRCTSCHISPTGGGLLSSYGRSLSGRELSMTSRMSSDPSKPGREEQFLWGALGNALGPVQLGAQLRPSHIRTAQGNFSDGRNIWMQADLLGAVQHGGFTFYGEAGRNPEEQKLTSYEHWGSYQTKGGYGIRAGRFFPAYGVRFADHTAFNRERLGFDMYDQVYGVELSRSGEKSLVQVTLSPGLARSFGLSNTPRFGEGNRVSDGNRPPEGTRPPGDRPVGAGGPPAGFTGGGASGTTTRPAFTAPAQTTTANHAFNATARVQFDVGSSMAIVASGVFREATRFQARNGSGGLALGLSPLKRVTVWTQADAHSTEGTGHSYIVVNETSVEAVRGLWLRLSPQLRTTAGRQAQVMRWAYSAMVLPRTHFGVEASYYHDKTKGRPTPTGTFLLQFNAYL